jgi:RHS repeat-associated protein
MSGSTTSADPDDLHRFVTTAQGLRSGIEQDIRALRRAYDEFNSSTDYPVVNFGLMEGSIPRLVKDLHEMQVYVKLLARALRLADRTGMGGVVTASTFTLLSRIRKMADDQGIDLNDLLESESIGYEPTMVWPVPQNSAWVADPVATATGFMVVDADDLLQGSQRFNHGWRRVYCSGFVGHFGALGRGWWSWADVRLDSLASDEVVLQCEDGARLPFVFVDDVWIGPAGVELTHMIGGWQVTWGSATTRSGATWSLDESGRLVTTAAPSRPAVTYEYVDDRLSRIIDGLTHPIEVRWGGTNVESVRRGNAVVEYEHDDASQLVSVTRGGLRRWTYVYDEHGRLAEEVDADGIVRARSIYDDADRVVEQTAGDGRVVRLRYDNAGTTVVVDPWGNETRATHDRAGRLIQVSGSEGAVFSRGFTADGTVAMVQLGALDTTISTSDTALGRETTVVIGGEVSDVFVTDDQGHLVEHRSGDGSSVAFRHDGDGRLSGISTAPGVEWTLDRAIPGRATVTDPDGVVASVESGLDGDVLHVGADPLMTVQRDELGRVVKVSNVDGMVASFAYDDGGRITQVIDSAGGGIEATYTVGGRLRSLREAGGATAEYVLDTAGRIAQVWRGDELLRSIEWHDDDRPSSFTQADGTWLFTYSERGQLASVTSPVGDVWTCTDNDNGQPLTVTSPAGVVLRCQYDARGQVIAVEDVDGARTLLDWDGAGNVASITDRSGAVTSVTRRDGRLVREVDADGVETVQEWSPAGRLIASRSDGVESTWRYDQRGRVVSRSHGPATWHYVWDERNVIVGVVDPIGEHVDVDVDQAGRTMAARRGAATWSVQYDAAGRITGEIDASGASTSFEYDSDGRVVATIDANGGRTKYEYDAVGRPVVVTTPSGASTRVELDTYDRPTAVSDAVGRVRRHSYRPGGGLVRTVHPDGSVEVIERDVLDRPVAVTVDGDTVVRYDLDPMGRIRRIDLADGRFEAVEFTDAGRLRSWTDGVHAVAWERRTESERVLRYGDRVVSESLDGAGLVAAIDIDAVRVTVDRDVAGRVRRISADTWDADIGYDGHAIRSTSFPASGTREFERDDLGRITRQIDGDASTSFSYDAAGQLTSVITAEGTTSYQYNTVGCLTEERTDGVTRRRYSYDPTGWLTAIVDDDGTTTVEHDARGRRVRETGPRGERQFEWGPFGLTAVVSESGRLEVETDLTGRPRRIGETRIVWEETPAGSRVLSVGDALVVNIGERPVAVSRSAGSVEWMDGAGFGLAGGRDAWGRPARDLAGDPTIGWRGGIEVAGLVWFGSRLYDPNTRCFLSPDPVDVPLVHPCSARVHHYCANDPVNLSDPSGATQVLDTQTLEGYRNDATGWQWGNIAADAIAVAAVAAAIFVPGGVLVAAAVAGAAGALGGVAQEVGDAMDAERPVDWGTMAINGTVGLVVGAAGGGIAAKLASPVRQSGTALVASMGRDAGIGAGQGFTTSVVTDVANGRPINWSNAAWGAGFGAVTGGAQSGLGNLRKPTTVSQSSAPPRPAVDAVQTMTPTLRPSLPPGTVVTPSLPPGWVQRPSGIVVPAHTAPLATSHPQLLLPAPRPQLLLPAQASPSNP